MVDKIGEITGDMMQTGVFPDLPQGESPIFKTASNVFFSDRSVQPIPGQYILSSTASGNPIRGMRATVIDGVKTLVYGTWNSIFHLTISGGVITPGSGYNPAGNPNSSNMWDFARWSDWVLATNNYDPPQIFKGSGYANLADIGNVLDKVRFWLPFGEYMLAVDDDVIAWCHRSNVEIWVAAAANSAGFITPQDKNGPFIGGIPDDTGGLIFTASSMHKLSYVGPTSYFGCKKVKDGPGIFSCKSLTSDDEYVYGMGPNGIFATDGSGYTFIDEGAVHDDIYERLNQNQVEKVIAWHDRHSKQIVFWFPTGTSTENSEGIGYNTVNHSWAPRNDVRTAAEESGVFPWGILGDGNGSVFAQSLLSVPVSAQDPILPLVGTGSGTMGFGQSGFGELGFGGTQEFTE